MPARLSSSAVVPDLEADHRRVGAGQDGCALGLPLPNQIMVSAEEVTRAEVDHVLSAGGIDQRHEVTATWT